MGRRAKGPTFAIGDRVTWLDPEKNVPNLAPLMATLLHALGPQKHGVVVPYKGKHKPTEPRVRWNDGWGYHVKSTELRLLTEEEDRALPSPTLADCDRPPLQTL